MSEVLLHVLQRNDEFFHGMVRVIGVRRVEILVGLGQAGEGIGDEHRAA